jgi:dolichyl-phosphate-mannose--protein O-mannosyl transferase
LNLFKDKLVGILSALVFSLDGLVLVINRIGMNDTYFLFFMLLTFWLFLRGKNFYSALTLGLSLASKWSALWFLPLLGVSYLILKRDFKLSYLWFLVLPPVVYILTYTPMFLSGHTLSQFVEVQKQMWWYHTNLRATHPYTSAWWSWPFLVRPVWLYTASNTTSGFLSGEKVANIYAMGNPMVFWFGMVAVATTFWAAMRERNKYFFLIAFAYLIFFVPWALSPRIMFLYHYLPSIPFLAIMIGVVLRRNRELIIPFLILAGGVFLFFYPHWSGIFIAKEIDNLYYWLPSWK